eukprot:CAMPEP_0113881192 /NCGR_PEP_ID=MMETSP0780_2-20120614/8228_1 /TAXON_ID=652834 /ORGANISM="Palpitomonas bilix" /LENGTH=528 /DNA_ID=CAMNT_0000867999 /DNA_START=136 /DNA_END=1722 /DNA_ORIENTATION=- /assembly_acc=CAM_ASM_000599
MSAGSHSSFDFKSALKEKLRRVGLGRESDLQPLFSPGRSDTSKKQNGNGFCGASCDTADSSPRLCLSTWSNSGGKRPRDEAKVNQSVAQRSRKQRPMSRSGRCFSALMLTNSHCSGGKICRDDCYDTIQFSSALEEVDALASVPVVAFDARASSFTCTGESCRVGERAPSRTQSNLKGCIRKDGFCQDETSFANQSRKGGSLLARLSLPTVSKNSASIDLAKSGEDGTTGKQGCDRICFWQHGLCLSSKQCEQTYSDKLPPVCREPVDDQNWLKHDGTLAPDIPESTSRFEQEGMEDGLLDSSGDSCTSAIERTEQSNNGDRSRVSLTLEIAQDGKRTKLGVANLSVGMHNSFLKDDLKDGALGLCGNAILDFLMAGGSVASACRYTQTCFASALSSTPIPRVTGFGMKNQENHEHLDSFIRWGKNVLRSMFDHFLSTKAKNAEFEKYLPLVQRFQIQPQSADMFNAVFIAKAVKAAVHRKESQSERRRLGNNDFVALSIASHAIFEFGHKPAVLRKMKLLASENVAV